MRAINAIIKLVILVDANQKPVDQSDLSDDDLKRVIRETISEPWSDDPGYDVDLPDDDILDEDSYV